MQMRYHKEFPRQKSCFPQKVKIAEKIWGEQGKGGAQLASVFRQAIVSRAKIAQRHAPAEWNLREISRFSRRFWRELLVKFSASDTQTLENVARGIFHKNFTPNFTTPLAEKNREKNFTPHFCRAAALTIATGSQNQGKAKGQQLKGKIVS